MRILVTGSNGLLGTKVLERLIADPAMTTLGADVMSRLAFARQIAATFDLDATLIDPISTSELGQPAPRPLRAGLLMDRFRATFPNVPVLSVAEGLAVLKAQLEV